MIDTEADQRVEELSRAIAALRALGGRERLRHLLEEERAGWQAAIRQESRGRDGGCACCRRDKGDEEGEEGETYGRLVRGKIRVRGFQPGMASDPELTQRARELLKKYLPEIAPPESIVWSMKMQCSPRRALWGVCFPSQRAIRISAVLKKLPGWVRDAVIVHELAHLKHANHGREFQKLVRRYPRYDESRSYRLQYMRELGDDHEAGIRARAGTRAPRAAPPAQRQVVNVSPGDIIMFGRPRGERTRARVVRVSSDGKVATVELLEQRGRGRGGFVGAQWRVSLWPEAVAVVQRAGARRAAPKRRRQPVPTRPPVRRPRRDACGCA